MQITVEISLYPFTEHYAPPIKEFIARLRAYEDVEVAPNATSTQIVGEHARIFDILSKETAQTFAAGKSVFVIKVLGFERDLHKPR